MSDIPFDPDDDNYEHLGRFNLDDEDEFEVDLWRNIEANDDPDMAWDFQALFDTVGYDPNSQEALLDLLTLPYYNPEDDSANIDTGSPDVRGGYDRDEIISFLNHTGFWGLATIYYDENLDTYYAELEGISP